jgi:hypothetical protein
MQAKVAICCERVARCERLRNTTRLPQGLGHDLTHATYGHMGLAKLKQLVSEGYIDKSKVENHAAAWFSTAGITMVMPAAFVKQ